jgi:hypothetical protein
VKYIDAGWASCSGSRRVKYLFIVKYIDVGAASCLGIGGLNTFINYVLEYADIEWAS